MDYAIIAAGEGSRLAQEGVKWPKPLVRLNGVALIDRLIDVFLKNNATSISIIVNEEMTEVQDYLKALRLPIPFYLLVKSTPSSMHRFYELSHYLDGDKICLTTVDTIFKEEEFSGYIQQFIQEDKLDGLMAVTDFIDDEKLEFSQMGTAAYQPLLICMLILRNSYENKILDTEPVYLNSLFRDNFIGTHSDTELAIL